MTQSSSKWQTSTGTKLFVFLLFFSLCALLLQHHLVMMSVLNRNLASLWTSKVSGELQIVQRRAHGQKHGTFKSKNILDTDSRLTHISNHQLGKAAEMKLFEETIVSRDTNPPVFSNETWQQMDNYQLILLKSVVFIDHRDPNSTPLLRFLLYKNHNLKHSGACLVKYSMQEEFKEIGGHFTLINLVSPKCAGGCAWRYEAYYFDCQLKQLDPISVKFKLISGHPNTTTELSESINHVHLSKPAVNPEHELAVCAKALYKYNVWLRLMLFVEVYQHLGASLFMLYNHSTTEDTNRLLNYYITQKKLELISWPSVPVKDPSLEYFKKFESLSKYGQMLAHNHCLLSLMGRARHVILVDIDEFIVPSAWNDRDTLKNSIPRLIEEKGKNKEKIGGFQVRSAYVNMTFPQYGSITSISVENLQLPEIFQQFQHFDVQKPGTRYALIYHLRDKKLPGKLTDELVNPFAPMKSFVVDAIKSTIKAIQQNSLDGN